MLAASGAGSNGLFYALLVLHVAAALTGFGSIGFAGTYAGRAAQLFAPARESGPALGEADLAAAEPSPAPPPAMTSEDLVRYFRRPAGLWWALLAVPWLGLGTLAAEPHGGGVGQAWAVGAFLLWAGAALVAAAVVVPALRRTRSVLVPPAGPGALSEPGALNGAARARVARSGRRASRGAAVCDILFFLALALMIWQP
jgi:hypothetical protein